MNKITFYITFLLVLLGLTTFGQYQNEEFGKNRIQYKRIKWQYLKTPFFDIYFYSGGTALAYKAARHAEKEMKRISEQIGYMPYSKVKIFLYNSHHDLLQSNMGLAEQKILSVGGQTNFFKLKMEIAFKGNQLAFEKELSTAIARTLVTDMVFNGNLREVFQSSFYQTLPEWFIVGLAKYLGEGWSLEMDDYMRDAIVRYRLKDPAKFTGKEAEWMGQSIWNFIAEKYGITAIPNVLNMTRIVKNEEYGIEANLGTTYAGFLTEWKSFYVEMNQKTFGEYTKPDKKLKVRKINRKNFQYHSARIDPSGQRILYAEQREGRYRVVLLDIETGSRRVVLEGGRRIIYQEQNYQIPIVSWRNQALFSVVLSEGGRFVMKNFEIKFKEKKTIVKENGRARFEVVRKPAAILLKDQLPFQAFDFINGFDYSDDGKSIVFSADKEGQSDIFYYEIARRGAYRQITNDKYDDLYPRFIKNSNAIVFSSNRTNDTLGMFDQEKLPYLNLYTYDPSKPRLVEKLRKSPHEETMALGASANAYYFVSDASGIQNIYLYDTLTKETRLVTRWDNGISDFDFRPDLKLLCYIAMDRGKEFLYVDRKFVPDSLGEVAKTFRQEIWEARWKSRYEVEPETKENAPKTPIDSSQMDEVDINNYVFDSERKPTGYKKANFTANKRSRRADPIQLFNDPFTITGPHPKMDFLRTNYVVTSGFYFDNLMGWVPTFQAGAVDMFGNHQFNGGVSVRVGDIASSNRFFAEYKFLGWRQDLKFKYERTQLGVANNFTRQRYTLDRIEAQIAHPFSHTTRLALSPFYAVSNMTNLVNLGQPDANSGYVGYRAEFVLDNTLELAPNQLKGTKGKLFYEDYYNTQGRSVENFSRLQGEIRHYEKIHNELTLATRLVAGSFLGSGAKQYVVGGLDNWVFSGVDNQNAETPLAPIAQNEDRRDILFMQYGTNLRGFDYGALSGKSQFLFNAELRWPIVRYFYKGTIGSSFLRNLMLTGFYDAGSAWSGNFPIYIPYLNPDGRNNTFNTTEPITGTSSFQAKVINYRNPVLQGFGLGVRTFLLGYYVKVDFAWGVRDYNINPLRVHLSLGYDF